MYELLVNGITHCVGSYECCKDYALMCGAAHITEFGFQFSTDASIVRYYGE